MMNVDRRCVIGPWLWVDRQTRRGVTGRPRPQSPTAPQPPSPTTHPPLPLHERRLIKMPVQLLLHLLRAPLHPRLLAAPAPSPKSSSRRPACTRRLVTPTMVSIVSYVRTTMDFRGRHSVG